MKSELDAINKRIRELELKSGLILTLDEKREEKIQNNSLQIMPVWEWLLINEI